MCTEHRGQTTAGGRGRCALAAGGVGRPLCLPDLDGKCLPLALCPPRDTSPPPNAAGSHSAHSEIATCLSAPAQSLTWPAAPASLLPSLSGLITVLPSLPFPALGSSQGPAGPYLQPHQSGCALCLLRLQLAIAFHSRRPRQGAGVAGFLRGFSVLSASAIGLLPLQRPQEK